MRGDVVFWVFETVILAAAVTLGWLTYRHIRTRGINLLPVAAWIAVAIALVIFFNIQQRSH
jgi:uncharacterized membrane protein YidH (DUF202 family)